MLGRGGSWLGALIGKKGPNQGCWAGDTAENMRDIWDHQRNACFHLPGFHFGHLGLTHSHVSGRIHTRIELG